MYADSRAPRPLGRLTASGRDSVLRRKSGAPPKKGPRPLPLPPRPVRKCYFSSYRIHEIMQVFIYSLLLLLLTVLLKKLLFMYYDNRLTYVCLLKFQIKRSSTKIAMRRLGPDLLSIHSFLQPSRDSYRLAVLFVLSKTIQRVGRTQVQDISTVFAVTTCQSL